MMNFKNHIACALLAVLMVLPMGQGILPLNATASDGMYGQVFSETLDFDDLKVGDRLSASYVNDALVWDFSSFVDGSGQSSPTRWKIYDDPKNAGNNVIGLVPLPNNTHSYHQGVNTPTYLFRGKHYAWLRNHYHNQYLWLPHYAK